MARMTYAAPLSAVATYHLVMASMRGRYSSLVANLSGNRPWRNRGGVMWRIRSTQYCLPA